MKSNGFLDLEVWKKAKTLAVDVYQISKSFPKEDLFGLTNQLRRSALSIPSNIAEGSAKGSDKDFCRYVMIALGSTAELQTQLIIANEIGVLGSDKYKLLVAELNDIGRMLKGLERKLRANDK